jgi:hypothetical protein
MKRRLAFALILCAAIAAAPLARQAQHNHIAKMTLKAGDPALDFTLLSDEWKTVKLSDYRGKKNVFLAVYVLAFTGG